MSQQEQTLNQQLLSVMDSYAGKTCFKAKQGQRYQNISYHRCQRLVFKMARFFSSRGIRNGERVAIVAENSLEWMVTYLACLLSGGIAVPLRTSLALDTLHHILQDSGASMVILGDLEYIQFVIDSINSDTENKLSNLNTILTMPNKKGENEVPDGVFSIDNILSDANPIAHEDRQYITAHAEEVSPQALACIHYITTDLGHSVGAVFDHNQLQIAQQNIAQWYTFDDDDVAFTVLAWSEAPSLNASLHYFLSGVPNALVDNFEKIIEDMQQISPTVMLGIPYTWELFYKGYMSWVTDQPESSQEVFKWAISKAKIYRAAGVSASPQLRQEYARADMTFFSEFRGRIGGRMRRLYSAGASLPQELAEFFEAIGLPVFNVYSLTEAGGFPAISRPGANQPGSCGQTVQGYEIKLAEDGEILVRGKTVMRHYWNHPEQTKKVLDADGWLSSGDVGNFDEDGYLYITSRKRHLMVLSTGRKISPVSIEKALTSTPFIGQAAIFGEGKPYVSAMIVPDIPALSEYFQDDGETVASTGHPRVKALLDEVIGEVNSHLDRWEQVREYNLLDQPLSQDAGELTPSMKISRHLVAEKYAAQIESMYPLTMQFDEKEVTQVQIDPERLRELLEKETILDAWLVDAGIEFIFDIARKQHIDAPSMVHICDTAASIAQMENEEKPLSTAIIVGDPIKIGRVLPESQIQLLSHDHIRRMRKTLVTLAKMVDGQVLGYVIDKYGYVRGVSRLEVELEVPGNYLGPQFRHHAAISKQCDAMVFFVPAGGRQVRVFAEGKLVGRYADGDWSPDNTDNVETFIEDLAESKGYSTALVKRVFRCAFQMSEENLGAIWLLGNAGLILQRSDAPEISSLATIISVNIDQLTDRELVNFAKQDGATVIDTQGKFRGCMVLLRPGANTTAQIGPGKGARHSSASKMSLEASCLAITVSQDGPITIYNNGERVLSL